MKEEAVRTSDVVILGVCLSLGVCLILLTGAATETVVFVGVLLVLLLAALGTRVWWP
jgi:hypothetical protein